MYSTRNEWSTKFFQTLILGCTSFFRFCFVLPKKVLLTGVWCVYVSSFHVTYRCLLKLVYSYEKLSCNCRVICNKKKQKKTGDMQ